MRKVLAAMAAALALGSPALAGTAEDVASFVQPTQEGRRAALETLLKREGLAYEIQPFDGGTKDKPAKGYNVVVTLGSGDRDILLTAHYDAEILADGTLAGAVVDNAASVVAMIQAAKVLQGEKLNHRLRIVLFDQEELGLVGAYAYAASPDGKRVASVINFDVNGYGDTPFFAEPKEPGLGKALRDACYKAGEDCIAFAKYPASDHLAFWKAKVPATSISILPTIEVHQIWLLVNGGKDSGLAEGFVPQALLTMHTPKDTMAMVDPAAVELAAKLAVEFVREADKLP